MKPQQNTAKAQSKNDLLNQPVLLDAALVEQSLQGDQSAFGKLVERYQSLICSVAYNRCGDLGLSEDIAQEVFLLGWKKLGSLGNPEKFKSWICTIARNHSSRSAQQWHRDVVGHAANGDSLESVKDRSEHPEASNTTGEQEDLVRKALSDLPETYRETMILFYREEQSVARVAESLDLTEATVRQRLVRGRALLRERVESVIESVLKDSAPAESFYSSVVAAIAISKPLSASTAVATTATGGTGVTGAIKAYMTKGLSFLLSPLVLLLPLGWYTFSFEVRDARSERERSMVILWLVSLVLATIVASVAIVSTGRPWLVAFAFMGLLFAGSLIWKRKRLALRTEENTATPLRPLFSSDQQGGTMMCIFIGSGLLASLGSLHLAIAASHWPALGAILGFTLLISLVAFHLAKNQNPKAQHYLFCLSLIGISVFSAVFSSTLELRSLVPESKNSAFPDWQTIFGFAIFLPICWSYQRIHRADEIPKR